MQRQQLYCYRAQGTSPTTTFLPLQDSRRPPDGHVIICIGLRALPCQPRYLPATPHCTAGHLLMSIKGGVQGPRGERRGKKNEHTSIRTHGRTAAETSRRTTKGQEKTSRGRTPSLYLPRSLLLTLSRPRFLATLVTPTTSTLVQDNTRLIPPLVFHLAPTHLGRDTQRQIYSSVQGPPGSEMPTVGAPGRGLLRVNKHFPIEFQMGRLQQPLQPGTMLRFGSLEFMSLDAATTWYSSLRSMTTTTVNGSPGGGNLHDGISPRRKRNTSVIPATLLVGGGGDEATVATQEAAPYRLSNQSEPTMPALL
jgi:hypothetical protein